MNTAERIAATIGQHHEMSGNGLHVYDDGYVAWIACSPERHEELLRAFREEWPEVTDGRTPDGFFSVFVLPCEPPPGILVVGEDLLMEVTDYYADHRDDDLHRIDILLPWAEAGPT